MLETILRLIAKVMNKTSFLFIWPFSISLSLAVRVYGLLFLLLMMTDGAPLLIVTASLPWRHTHTHTHLTTNTHHSCCAVSWLATFWAYVPHGALYLQCSVWKLLISTLYTISALCSAMARANCGHITLLDDRKTCFHPVMSQGLWPAIQYKRHQSRTFFSSDCFVFVIKSHHKSKHK